MRQKMETSGGRQRGSMARKRMAGIGMAVLLLSGWSAMAFAQEKTAPSEAKEATAEEKKVVASNNVVIKRTPEDFSVITLDKSELVMQPVTPGEFDNMEKYTRELLQVQWRMLDPFDLYVIKPKGVVNPPVILYLYSYPTSTKTFQDPGWCERATSGGYAAVGFLPALAGDRFQMRPMREWFMSELQESLGTTTHDVQMILNYLEKRGDIDTTRVGIFGTGSGATVGILAAAADPRIKVLDLGNPWGDWPEWLSTTGLLTPFQRPDFLKPEFLAKVAPLDPVKWFPKLTQSKIRVQLVDDPEKLTKASVDAIEKSAPAQAKVIRYDSAKTFQMANGKTGFGWVKDQLKELEKPVAGSAATTAQNGAAKEKQ